VKSSIQTFLSLTFMLSAWLTSAGASEPTVRCVLGNGKTEVFDGKCIFIRDNDGSFAVMTPNNDYIMGASSISVRITKPGHAEVRGLTAYGINSRWGPARRSEKDKACWLGDDFSICVYKIAP
jgi:hypothetical protein